ncbi:MAG: DUF2304 domain-containing protein [Coriobacteriaceae bacterium]|jgi:hypothetical protein|uniref:DUF2304 domain-containing protein n=1 Tax=Atopobium sp. oral taxon 416 TaxID=712157 RepID=UPI000FF1B9BC|nr:DUF2304 domain-containing protein [Atopobium sp. oral taxon 416]QUC03368.1 DUF2304 domain-containing protein [Atopobium sp. oral taxon 416]RRF96634.1 MAG: DUF2304 domain-containing protein [Coriobacteriaceae bacterium]
MSPVLRVVLIVGSVLALAIVIDKVKKSKIRIKDSIFWVISAVLLVILAVFPGIAFFFSRLLGFLSPSNFVFVVIIALMLIKLFNLSSDVSRLTDKVESLAQEIALWEHDHNDQNNANQH